MDLKTIKLFLALSQQLNFAQASRLMHVSPSTLSRAISQLEQRLAVVLFERDQRKVRLTDAGILTRHRFELILEQWQALQRELKPEGHDLQGQIKLYCSVTASYGLLIDLLQRFRSLHPRVEVIVETGDAADAIHKIQANEVDIAIAPRPEQLPKNLDFHQFAHTPLRFIAPVIDCPLSEPLTRLPQSLSELPFILAEHGLARARLLKWWQQKKISPPIYAQVAGHEAIVAMVALGLGVGVVPELVLLNSPMAAKVRVLALEPELEAFAIGLCAAKIRLSNPGLQAFWQLVK